MPKQDQFGAQYASPRPWRIEHTSKQGHSIVKGADDCIVAVCHADNASIIVEAVNAQAVEKVESLCDIEEEMLQYGDRPPPRKAWIDIAHRIKDASADLFLKAYEAGREAGKSEAWKSARKQIRNLESELATLKEGIANFANPDYPHSSQ